MARWLLAPLAVVASLAAGLWLLGGLLASSKWSVVAVSVAWFFVVSAVAARVVRRRPELRLPVRGTFVACAALASVGFYWTSVRKSEVDERVAVPSAAVAPAEREAALRGEAPAPSPTPTATATATATHARDVRLARGAFRGADGHAGSGTATVVRRAEGGRRLAFTDFDVDGGIDVRVYLVDGNGAEVSDHVELGRLKGERGDQQYTVPASVDLSRYRSVVLWCVPATVRIAVAPLR